MINFRVKHDNIWFARSHYVSGGLILTYGRHECSTCRTLLLLCGKKNACIHCVIAVGLTLLRIDFFGLGHDFDPSGGINCYMRDWCCGGSFCKGYDLIIYWDTTTEISSPRKPHRCARPFGPWGSECGSSSLRRRPPDITSLRLTRCSVFLFIEAGVFS